MRGKRMTAVACGVAALVATGCSVQEATNVGSTTATLNARIVNPTIDFGVAYGFYAAPIGTPITAGDGFKNRVGDFRIVGPLTDWTDVSQAATGLEPDTDYHYTLCGSSMRTQLPFDSLGSGCLPEKTFRTDPALTKDWVKGGGTTAYSPYVYVREFEADVRGGSAGETPSGRAGLAITVYGDTVGFSGPVTCLKVTGKTAVLVFDPDAGNFTPGPYKLSLVDHDGNGPDTIDTSPESDVTDCSPIPSGGGTPIAGALPLDSGDIRVNDAPVG